MTKIREIITVKHIKEGKIWHGKEEKIHQAENNTYFRSTLKDN